MGSPRFAEEPIYKHKHLPIASWAMLPVTEVTVFVSYILTRHEKLVFVLSAGMLLALLTICTYSLPFALASRGGTLTCFIILFIFSCYIKKSFHILVSSL